MINCSECLVDDYEINISDLLNIIPYIPYSTLKELSSAQCCAFRDYAINKEGTIVFFDIVQFSPLVFSFIKDGNSGVEIVNKILTEYYTELIIPLRKFGGTVYQFAGDSVLVGFDPDENESPKFNIERALSAVSDFIINLEIFNRDFMSQYNNKIQIRIGISYGSYSHIILGSKELSFTSAITGKAVTEAIEAEKGIHPDEICVNKNILKYIDLAVKNRELNQDNYVLKENYFDPVDYSVSLNVPEFMENPRFLTRCRRFINNEIYKRALSGFEILSSEHREITCLLLRVTGINLVENPDEGIKSLNEFYRFVQKEADRYGGTLLKPDLSDKGSVFIIIFGAPLAMEKKELLTLQFAIKLLKEKKKFKSIEKLQFGISTGMAYCGDFGTSIRKDYSIIGNVINIAARLMTFSNESGIYLDENSIKKINDGFIYKELGFLNFKGISKPINTFKLLKIKRNSDSLLNLVSNTKIIGRDVELNYLMNHYLAATNKNGNCTGIIADAGIGKTLLVNTFLTKFDPITTEILTAKCFLYEKSTLFYPWREIFLHLFSIPLNSSRDKIIESVQGYCNGQDDPQLHIWGPLILKIMGIDIDEHSETYGISQAQKEIMLFQVILNILIKKSKNKPCLIIFEDIHWIDDKSQLLLKYIISEISKEQIYLIFTTRDEDFSNLLTRYKHYEPLLVSTLSIESSRNLIQHLLKLKENNVELENKIIKASQCNPFYIDTIIKSLKDNKMITSDETGIFTINGNIKNLEIPDSIKNVILSRIDLLESKEQLVIKTASVLGHNFPYMLLSSMLDSKLSDDNELKKSLDILESHDLMNKEDITASSYMFKHMSIRDVVYQTLLQGTRSRLNLTLASYLEENSKEDLFSYSERLALHFFNGGEYSKALYYSLKSSEKAKSLFATEDVIQHNLKALEICKIKESEENVELKDTTFKIKLDLIKTYRSIGQYENALNYCNTVVSEIEDNYNIAQIYKEMGHIYQEIGDMQNSIFICEKGLKLLGCYVPDSLFKTYTSIGLHLIIRVLNDIPLIRNIKYNPNNFDKLRLIVDLLSIVNRIYYFDMLEKSAWSAVLQYNISEHIDSKRLLSLAATDFGVAMVSSGMKNFGFKHAKRGVEISSTLTDLKTISICKSRFALYYLFHNDSKKSNELLESAILNYKKIGEMWELMTALGTLGQNYFNLGEYDKSISSYVEADTIAKQLNSLAHQAWRYCKVPYMNYIRGKISYFDATAGLFKAVEISTQARDTMNLCITYGHLIELAIIENQKKEIHRLIDLIIESNKTYIADIPHIRISLINACEGAIYLSELTKDIDQKIFYKDKIKYLLKWIDKLSKTYKYIYGPYLTVLARYYNSVNNNKMAKKTITKSLNELKNSPYKREYAQSLKLASVISPQNGSDYIKLHDSIYSDLGLIY
ncbi:MAG: AAA family ATPase [Spirochaetales bacterium]|nr:AAA family ATPase [Spirochaetales bacterium]